MRGPIYKRVSNYKIFSKIYLLGSSRGLIQLYTYHPIYRKSLTRIEYENVHRTMQSLHWKEYDECSTMQWFKISKNSKASSYKSWQYLQMIENIFLQSDQKWQTVQIGITNYFPLKLQLNQSLVNDGTTGHWLGRFWSIQSISLYDLILIFGPVKEYNISIYQRDWLPIHR